MVENFVEELLRALQVPRDGSEYEFRLMEVVKRNDKRKQFLCIRQKGEDIGVNLFVDELRMRYEDVDCDMDTLSEEIMRQLKGHLLSAKFTDAVMEQVLELQDYEKMKNKVLFMIVNEVENREYLKNAVYVPFLDFAICFYVVVGTDEKAGTIMLTKDIFDSWDITVEDLYQQAKRNAAEMMPYQFRCVDEVLEQVMSKDSFTQYMNSSEIPKGNSGLFVLGNTKQMFGAGTILYEGVMKQIATMLGMEELVILPSSVHECILLQKPEDVDVAYLRQIVHQVNGSCVEPEERLSENVYLYSTKTDEITVLTE